MKLSRISLFKCCHFSDKWNSCCICIFFLLRTLCNILNCLNSFLMWPLKIFSISSSNFNLCHVLGFKRLTVSSSGIKPDIIPQFDTLYIPQLNINPYLSFPSPADMARAHPHFPTKYHPLNLAAKYTRSHDPLISYQASKPLHVHNSSYNIILNL